MHPLDDDEISLLCLWETPQEIPAFRAGWLWFRQQYSACTVPALLPDPRELGPEYDQNARVAWSRGAEAARAVYELLCDPRTIEERMQELGLDPGGPGAEATRQAIRNALSSAEVRVIAYARTAKEGHGSGFWWALYLAPPGAPQRYLLSVRGRHAPIQATLAAWMREQYPDLIRLPKIEIERWNNSAT